MSNDTNNMVDNDELLTSIKGISGQISSLSGEVNTLDKSVDGLTRDVNRNAESYNKLSSEHSSLITRVNHIDMRISIMEETTRLQTKHNDQVHADFKRGLSKLETSIETLTDKLDGYFETTKDTSNKISDRITQHTIEEEKWQKGMYKAGMLIGFSMLIAVVGFISRWAFLTLTASPLTP